MIGTGIRYGLDLLFPNPQLLQFPIATFCINITGSFLIGVTYIFGFERTGLGIEIRTGIMAGLLGGFTTFSSYSLQSLQLILNGRATLGLLYITLSPILGIGATYLAFLLFKRA
jgi:CrcB protein